MEEKKTGNRIKTFWNRLKNKWKDLTAMRCPKCGGRMSCFGYDSIINHLVYECEDCGEKWV